MLLLGVCLLRGDRADGFAYFTVESTVVVWAGAESLRFMSPSSFPADSDAELLLLESMGLWNIVPDSDFTYSASRLDQDYPIDHFDGYNDTVAVLASELDPGVLGVTYLVVDGAQWYDMDILFSDSPLGVGYTLATNPDCEIVANPLTYGFSFLLIAVHEMGHALGLGHDPVGDEPSGTPWFIATMNPRYPAAGPVGQENIVEVHTDDRSGIRFLYPAAVPENPPVHDLALAGYMSSSAPGAAIPLEFSPLTVLPGDELSLISVIENFGTADDLYVRQGFYLSTDPLIEPSDQLIGLLRWDLVMGDAAEFGVAIDMPGDLPAGTYHVGSILDDLNEVAEIYEDNNAISYCEPLSVGQLAPVIDPIDAQDAACGGFYTGPAPSVTHPLNMSPITWTLQSPPVGMTIDPATGVISWPSPASAYAPYTITIRATNDAGTATKSLALTVAPGDTSGNGLLDLADLADFTACITGPEIVVDPACTCSDLDADGDIDLQDVGAFQLAIEN